MNYVGRAIARIASERGQNSKKCRGEAKCTLNPDTIGRWVLKANRQGGKASPPPGGGAYGGPKKHFFSKIKSG